MKNKLLLVTLFAVSLFLFVGCGKSDPLEGTWKGLTDGESRNMQIETTFTFKGGEVEYKNEYGFNGKGTYEIKDDSVTIKLEIWNKEKVYKFDVKDDTLSLTATDKYSPSYSELKKQ